MVSPVTSDTTCTTWREESNIVAERPSSGAAALTYSLHTIIVMYFVHTTSVMRGPYTTH